MYCSECGEKINDDTKFCPFCGHSITSNGSTANKHIDRHESSVDRNKTESDKKIFLIIYFCTIIFNMVALIINIIEMLSSQLSLYDTIWPQAQMKPYYYFIVFIIFISFIIQVIFIIEFIQKKDLKRVNKSYILSMIIFMVSVVFIMLSFACKYVIDNRPDLCIVDSPGVLIASGILVLVLFCIIIPLMVKGKKEINEIWQKF